MYEIKEKVKNFFKNLIFTCMLIFLIVNNGNILTGGNGRKNERERVQREL